MRNAISSSSGSSRAKNHHLHRFMVRHLRLWLVLLTLGAAVVLSSVLAGARDESRKSAAGAEQKRGTKSMADVLNEKGHMKLGGNGNSDVSGTDSKRLLAELFMNPPAPRVGTTLTAASPTTLGATPNNNKAPADPGGMQEGILQSNEQTGQALGEKDKVSNKPKEERLTKAHPFNGDLRDLPHRKPVKRERPELEGPEPNPTFYPGTSPTSVTPQPAAPSVPDLNAPAPAAPAPAPSIVFEGLDRENWGAGSPPDTNGDVGPTYYIQSVNTSVGIYRKSDGFREAAFTFDTLMSQGNFGNLCDTNNFGDPVVLYDTFEDRWILTDFAFLTDVSGNVVTPAYQCFAVSKNGNPVSGGWNFYSIKNSDFLNDYPKLGIWTDGLYMSANMFSFGAGSTFQGVRVWSFNKAQMYAGSPTVKVVSFNLGTSDFTVVPANARLQTGTPPPGRPNLFLSTWNFLNAVSVYKFHVDWNSISLSTFTGPDVPLAGTSWPNANVANAPQPGTATLLDVLQIRAMVQNEYTNLAGTESLWVPHTVRRANTTGFAAPRWYQVDVTGGTVAANLPQATTWDPDAANVIHRYMPSLALDRAGNMAMGYTTSSSTEFPSMRYAGRLSTDPVNTFSQTEQTLFAGTASQTGSTRWGDYSSMMLDPDGCTFWYTNEYANPISQTFDKRWLTKIGSFKFAECTPVGAGGTLTGTVTATMGGAPISGATIQFGARTTTTNGSGIYSFLNLPAGTYPTVSASFPGYITATASTIVVTDGGSTIQNLSLGTAPTSACLTDTTQADFQMGISTNVDLVTSSGDVTLLNAANIDQQNTTLSNSGVGITITTWGGQTFTAGVTGQLTRADINLFCSGCTGTAPTLTLSVRDTSGNLPTGADLATATLSGNASGASSYFVGNFASPPTLTAGTVYALVVRPTVNPSAGIYAITRSSTNVYAGGQRVSSADSGSTWTAPLTAGQTTDAGFKTYMNTGFALSGNQISGLKDANPAVGLVPRWLTLSWTAATPVNTAVQFQAAASNSIDGPFNFVGPDGTASTFFTTTGASLSQFNGFRYLKYEALLSTTDNTMTPTLNDVTVCFDNSRPAIAASAPLSRQQGAAASNAQIATVSDAGQAANTLTVTAAPLTGTGVTITNISVDVAGNVTADVAASCTATNSTLTLTVTNSGGGTATATLTVNVTASATPTITPGGPTTFCTGGSVTLTSSSASGNQWYLDGNPIGGATAQQYVATASGGYTVTANGCTTNPSVTTTVTVNPIPATPTITPGGPTTFCAGGSVTLTSSSASGNHWFLNGNPIGGATNQAYIATASGGYTVTDTASGCTSATSSATTVTVNPIPATPTITPGGPTTFCAGGSVTLTSSSASGNQWYLNGNPIGGATNQAYIATASGGYTVTDRASGCTSAASSATTITVNPIPATPIITPGGPTTFCTGGSVTLTSSSASGNQWYLNNNPIGGATAQAYIASVAGNYTDIVTASGCSSAISAARTVTVNPIPTTPTITPGGPTTFCNGGSVTLTSSSASGNQWYLGGIPIGGATNQTYNATTPGKYTVTVTASGCVSAPSTAITVTADTPPTLTYGNQAVDLIGSLSINPATGPSDNLTVSSIVVQSLGTYTGTISVSNTTGVVSVSNAAPAGTHTITIRATDNCGATTDASFTLNVINRPLISLSNANYSVNESDGFVTITVNRTGDLSVPVSVDYATDDTGSSNVCGTLNSGMASARCDFGLTLGTLKFAASEVQKTFIIPITQDSYTEGPEMFTVNLSNLTGTGAALATPSSATVTISDSAAPAPNANDDTATFVREQYHDFLNREPDAAGLAFWKDNIDKCNDPARRPASLTLAQCIDAMRVDTSAAFFLSIEFQTTGNLVRSFYVTALNRPLTNNMEAFVEFERDTQAVQRGVAVGQGNWQQTLNDNLDAFMKDFVTRAEFVGLYPTTDTPAQYVDELYLHAAVTPATPAERQAAIDEFAGALTAADPEARGRALLRITQNVAFQNREINRSFAQMEYFGYLRRNPNDAPDGDFTGYDFWLNKLNAAGGNYVSAEMVKSFIVSAEYRRRFGP